MAQRYISDAAFSLYAYYCMRRNRTSGGWNVSASLACTELGISRAAFYRLKSELVEKGWVEAQRNFIKPLFGFDREEVSKLRPESLKTETDYILHNQTSLPATLTSEEATQVSPSPPEENDLKKTAKRGTRIPEDFALTAEMIDYARQKRPTIDFELETEKFINFFTAKTGRDATKLDWKRTWMNWILNAREQNGHKQHVKPADVGRSEFKPAQISDAEARNLADRYSEAQQHFRTAMTAEEEAAWFIVQTVWKQKVPAAIFQDWFAKVEFGGFEDDGKTLVFYANEITRDWLKSNYTEHLQAAARAALSSGGRIRWRTDTPANIRAGITDQNWAIVEKFIREDAA